MPERSAREANLPIASASAMAGPPAFPRVQNTSKARWLREQILRLPGYEPLFSGPFFNEFAVTGPESPGRLRRRLAKSGILGGLHLGRWFRSLKGGLLFCATEDNSREEMEKLVDVLGGAK